MAIMNSDGISLGHGLFASAGTFTPRRIKVAVFLLAVSLASGCSKSDGTAFRQVQATLPPLALTTPTPATTPKRQTAAERLVAIDLLLAAPLTGTPEQADERTRLRAERAALISSGQVPYQAVQANSATVAQRSVDGDLLAQAAPAADTQNGQIVIAPNSQASSLPFLEQMTPSERLHYFQELRLQNSSYIDVNVQHPYYYRGRRWGWHTRR
jgi:hypothetical protein